MDSLGDRAAFTVADVSSVAECQGLVADVVATHGRLDVLVNNAGVTKSLGFFDVTEADWDRIYSVNAHGLFFCMQAAAVAMRDQGGGGRIVNIASIAGKGYRGTSNVAYAGTKGAVIAMTRISASQLARYGINVNSICPGVTRTSLFEQVIDELVERTGASREEAEAQAPRPLDPAAAGERPVRHRRPRRLPRVRRRPQRDRPVLERRRRPPLGLTPAEIAAV